MVKVARQVVVESHHPGITRQLAPGPDRAHATRRIHLRVVERPGLLGRLLRRGERRAELTCDLVGPAGDALEPAEAFFLGDLRYAQTGRALREELAGRVRRAWDAYCEDLDWTRAAPPAARGRLRSVPLPLPAPADGGKRRG